MKTISVESHKKEEVIDITEEISQWVGEKQVTDGICTLFALHTTCSLTTADLDPGTDKDILSFLRAIQPTISYNHPHDPSHAPDHILSSLIGQSVNVPVIDGKLELGTWQRIVLIELDGPRQRKVVCSIVKEYEE